MPTPNAARHRDLEQRLRHIENQLRQLTSAALYRRQLGVDQGDFVVQGGGSVVVRDGGGMRALYPDGTASAYFGPLEAGAESGDGLLAAGTDGSIFAAWQKDGGTTTQVWGSADDVLFFGPGKNSYIWLNPDGDLQLQVASGRNFFLGGHSTTANGANCYLGTNGVLQRSTSSLRYKTDVRIPRIDVQTVLAMQPRAFRDKGEVEREGDDARTHVGFIAEEAAELGLEPWVDRDDEGRPDAFNYAQWGVAQQAVLREHQARIDDLEQKLSDQADTIAALEARLAAAGL